MAVTRWIISSGKSDHTQPYQIHQDSEFVTQVKTKLGIVEEDADI